jgi:hypothetical protein
MAAAAGWEAAEGLSAGTLVINDSDVPGFTTIAAFETWLSAQPVNTADTAYDVALNVNDISDLWLIKRASKYVCLDLSGSTFTNIGDYAFRDCTSLTSVTIPNSVTYIGREAFFQCSSLTGVTFEGNINEANFHKYAEFPGNLRDKYLA